MTEPANHPDPRQIDPRLALGCAKRPMSRLTRRRAVAGQGYAARCSSQLSLPPSRARRLPGFSGPHRLALGGLAASLALIACMARGTELGLAALGHGANGQRAEGDHFLQLSIASRLEYQYR